MHIYVDIIALTLFFSIFPNKYLIIFRINQKFDITPENYKTIYLDLQGFIYVSYFQRGNTKYKYFNVITIVTKPYLSRA